MVKPAIKPSLKLSFKFFSPLSFPIQKKVGYLHPFLKVKVIFYLSIDYKRFKN